jgi:hypothetical protein
MQKNAYLCSTDNGANRLLRRGNRGASHLRDFGASKGAIFGSEGQRKCQGYFALA